MLKNEIKEFRLSKNVSIKDLAESLDLPINTIKKYENGSLIPSDEILEKIEAVYDIKFDRKSVESERLKMLENNTQKSKIKGSIGNFFLLLVQKIDSIIVLTFYSVAAILLLSIKFFNSSASWMNYMFFLNPTIFSTLTIIVALINIGIAVFLLLSKFDSKTLFIFHAINVVLLVVFVVLFYVARLYTPTIKNCDPCS